MNVIDFSSYTTIPTPEQVACLRSRGVHTAIIGTRGNGPKFGLQVQACLDGGLEVAAYVFLYASEPGDSQAVQAVNFCRPFPEIKDIWLDVESDHKRTVQLPMEAWHDCLFAAFPIVDDYAGHENGIYTSRSMWASLMDNTQAYGDRRLWDAQYARPNHPDTAPLPFVPYGGWKEREIVQYAGSVQVCGLNVDANEEEPMQKDVRDAFTEVLKQQGKLGEKADAALNALVAIAKHVYGDNDPQTLDIEQRLKALEGDT